MPSVSSLTTRLSASLIAGGAQPKRQVSLGGGTAGNTAGMPPCPLLQSMLNTMVCGAYYHKVFRAVIACIPIFMVHMKSCGRVCNDTVFIRPRIGLRHFYADIHEAVSGFVRSFSADGQRDPNFVQHRAADVLYTCRQRLPRAIRASRGVVVRIAVCALCTYDLGVAERAQLVRKFFRHGVFYAKQYRIVNAF